MKRVEYLDIDDDVNVYVVGDIHGCWNYCNMLFDRFCLY